jgi:hypothetical protein
MSRKSFFFMVFCAGVLFLGIRGIPGNPSDADLNQPHWKENGPFELSPERGRFALLYSLVENRSAQFSLALARFAAPDVALSPSGGYTSLFTPGFSVLLFPGYIAGKWLGASQLGTVLMVAFFALCNAVLLREIVLYLGGNPFAASAAAFTFLFATPAFAYAVSLYQHHLSTFLILSSIYLLLRFRGWWPLAWTWFAYALSIGVDNPNALLMLPVALYALGNIVRIQPSEKNIEFGIRLAGLTTLLAAAFPIALLFWFNQSANGGYLRLSGTLPRVQAIDVEGKPATSDLVTSLGVTEEGSLQDKKTAVGFFESRNLLNGFYVHSISPDRGVAWYAPVVFLGIAGLVFLYARHPRMANVLTGVAGVTVVLYSMWGDPYGGWAFGSRYLIPAYAMLAIGVGLALTRLRYRYTFVFICAVLFAYSSWVNVLGAVTTNANPPQVEVLNLEKLLGKEQKYTFERNWQYLHEAGSKTFVFQVFANRFLTAVQYYFVVLALVWGGMLYSLIRLSLSPQGLRLYNKNPL